MKRLFFLLLLIPFFASSQKYQDALLYGKKENRTINLIAMGLPRDTAILNDTAKLYPHIALKNDTLRIWNPGLNKWLNVHEGGAFDMDVFLVGGQSNARGLGDSTTSPNPEPGTVYKYDGTFQQVNNEIITPLGPIAVGSRGSAWPSFGITYNRLTGKKVCIIPYGIDGSGQMAASNTGFGDWGPTGTLLNASITQVNNAMSAIIAAGFIPKFKGVLWAQGENDAIKINASVITSTQYKDTLTWMINQYRTNFGLNMPFYIFQTGTEITVSDVGYAAVRLAQQQVVDANPLRNHMVSRLAYDYMIAGMRVDNIHLNQAALSDWGVNGAISVVNGIEGQWNKFNNYLTYTQSNVGIGTRTPTHPFTVSSTGEPAKFITSGGGTSAVIITNTTNGGSAGGGLRFENDLGLGAQMVYGSSTNFFNPNGISLHPFNGALLMGSNNSDVRLFTGASGPVFSNTRLMVTNAGRIGIGVNVTPNSSSLVDMVSTTGGLLIPRMTGAQMGAISSPATGLLIYNTDSLSVCHYNGSAWAKLGSGTGGGGGGCTTCWDVSGNSITAGTHFLGTTNNTALRLRSNNSEYFRIDSTGEIRFLNGLGTTNVLVDNIGKVFAIQFISNSGSGTVFASSLSNAGYVNGPITISPLQDLIWSPGNSEKGRFTPAGKLGIGTTAPISVVHSTGTIRTDDSLIVGGHTKLNGLTTTIGASGTPMVNVVSSTANLDFGSIAASSYADLTITLTGVATSDVVYIGVPHSSVSANISFFAWVSSSNTVTVRCTNNDPSNPVDPASGSFRVSSMIF